MNPWDLTATGLMVWGLFAHRVADWPLQNDWMANNKASSIVANVAHSAIHAVALAFVFGWVALPLAVVHGLIDTRVPVAWWSRLVGQTQPNPEIRPSGRPLADIGTIVRFETDQVFHYICIAVAALAVGA